MCRLLTLTILVGTTLLPFAASADADPRILRAWKAKCSGCHGDDGKGQTEAGKKAGVEDMTAPAWQKKLTDDQIKTVITKGLNELRGGRKVEMPPVTDLRPEQLEGLVKMVRSFVK